LFDVLFFAFYVHHKMLLNVLHSHATFVYALFWYKGIFFVLPFSNMQHAEHIMKGMILL